jgi:hypothetical protein
MHLVPGPSGSPYRSAAEVAPRQAARARHLDGDVLVAMLVLWIASVVRVAGAAMRHEVFGTEASLAFLSAAIVPWVFARWAFEWLMNRRKGPASALRVVRDSDRS